MVEPIMFDDLKKEKPLKIKYITINDKQVEVKQYLPVNDKLNLIGNVLKGVAANEGDYAFPNAVQMDVYTILEIISHYTSIGFTDEQKADPAKLYDELEKYDIANMVIASIPKTEYQFVVDGIEQTIKAYYDYRNSVKGLLEDITTDYQNLNLEASEIQKKLGDPQNMAFLKDVMKKLG